MRRRIIAFGLGSLVTVVFGIATSGCHSSETAAPATTGGAPAAGGAPPASAGQAVQSIQNDPKLNPQLKSQLSSQFQNPSGRPPGAPAAPIAH